ncbi:MAG: hypothetical protein QOJ64_2608 [Acidobacteriota bacterium]|jgi:hypothetical protein|nr:hypothetical protein [Acidobacteriota bacterium]
MLVVDVYYSRFSIYDSAVMYRKPRFLEELHAIREEMSREADYDVDLFTQMLRSGVKLTHGPERNVRGFKSRAPRELETVNDAPQRGRRKRG